MKNTKRALLLSALALVMCVAMLIGSTFAWFTDSASTAVNTIQSGTLKIDIASDKDGVNSLEGETLNFVAKDGTTNVLWEPNCTFNTEEFYIVNEGNLALKFQFDITGAIGDVKLLDVIDFTAKVTVPELEVPYGGFAYIMENYELDLLKGVMLSNGTSLNEYVLKPGESFGPIAISGHMDKDAGNEYQGLTVQGLAINLIATQAMSESDSIDESYDKDAEYLSLPKAKVESLGTVVLDENSEESFLDATSIIASWAGVSSNSTYTISSPFTIDAAYNFKAPATVDPNYATWNADFVVSVDADIDADSLILTGQYESFLPDTWVAFTNFVPVSAGEEIRLLTLAGQAWSYKDICEIVKEFKCGVSNIDVPAGVTFTVALKVFETDANGDETGVEHTVALVNYEF